MTNHLGRAMGVTIVGLGLLALVVSAPADDQNGGAARSTPDIGDRAADQLRGLTGDRMPARGAEVALDSWGDASRRAADAITQKYGDPDEVSDGRLVWHNTGMFRMTVVHKDPVLHNFPSPHADVLEQSIECRVPLERYGDLARFDGSVRPDRTTGLLSARGADEASNFAALNLAREIAEGKRSVDSARRAFGRISYLKAAGKTSPYTQGLLFKARSPAADPDQPVK
jgi:hypothetical protein